MLTQISVNNCYPWSLKIVQPNPFSLKKAADPNLDSDPTSQAHLYMYNNNNIINK